MWMNADEKLCSLRSLSISPVIHGPLCGQGSALLSLESPKWAELDHAYGSAENLPNLIRQLEALPPEGSFESEPYSTLWSSLCHQGDVYSASYAAVPHLVRVLEVARSLRHWTVLLLVVSIETSRMEGRGPEIREDLQSPYLAALSRLPKVVADSSHEEWDETATQTAAAAVAVAKGRTDLADAILELSSDILPKFRKWIRNL
jgi:hypothetical protein